MPRVHLPDGRVVNFPYSMTPEQIQAEVAKLAGPPKNPYEYRSAMEEPGYQPASPGQTLVDMGKQAIVGGVLGGAGRLLSAAPKGRILTSALAGAKETISDLPFVRSGIGAAKKAWQASRPTPFHEQPLFKQMEQLPTRGPMSTGGRTPMPPAQASRPTPFHEPVAGPQLKPKLTARQTAEFLRTQVGSEQAGRMLYGPVQRGADAGSAVTSAAARKDAIKRLTPQMESQLPQRAQQAINQGLQEKQGAEAWSFISKAPNMRAREYLLSLMRSGRTP